MTTTVVNLTLLKVMGELENILANYPAQIHHKISQNSELRNKLVNYVLSKIPNQHVVIDKNNVPVFPPELLYASTLEQLEIEELIQQAIYRLIQEENRHKSLINSKKIASS